MSTRTGNTPTTVELAVGGMTCTSCAARVEKKLNKLPGVFATVNYSTEKATIELPENLTLTDAIATIESTGYTASPVTREVADNTEEQALKFRLVVSTILTIPVVLLAMVPPLNSITGNGYPSCSPLR